MATTSSSSSPSPSISPSLSFSSFAAVGIDLGSFHARVATYDTNLHHAVVCANHDGHFETRVTTMEDKQEITIETLQQFYETSLLGLATSAAHTKDVYVVTSVPNDHSSSISPEWMNILTSFGSVITEAAATCLAYGIDATPHGKRVLVLDGGASGLKATVLQSNNGLWVQDHYSKLDTVNGTNLVEPLAQAVAQQFEQKHRFPKGEVWQSKKAKLKLLKACEDSLSTFQRINNVSIHVDSLYEGMDCNVSISKPKWEHLSSKLATQVKVFCRDLPTTDVVLIAGKLHDWMTPIIKSVLGSEKVQSSSGMDPSGVVAIGCTLQSYWNLQHQQQNADKEDSAGIHTKMLPTVQVPCCPVAIGIETDAAAATDAATLMAHTLISQGMPLPCTATHELTADLDSLQLVQLEPSKKPLATFTELKASTTIKLQLSAQGRLRIWVDGESIVIG